MKSKTLKKNKINIITLGCSKNMVDSEVLSGQLASNDIDVVHESSKKDHNIVIVNTCGFIDKAKEESRNWFERIRNSAKEDNMQIEITTEVILTGLAAYGEIIQYAEKEKIDLIVIGTRGKTGFKKLLLGSTASGVVTYAHCPVMVVK